MIEEERLAAESIAVEKEKEEIRRREEDLEGGDDVEMEVIS